MNIFCKGIKKLSDYVTFPCDSTGDIPQSLNLSILSFSDSQFLRFSVSQILFWAFRLRRRAFRYIFARFLPHPNPVPALKSRTQIPLPKNSQRMPLQSLTQRGDNKIIILLLRISRSSSFAYFLYETTLQQLFQCAFNSRFANIRTKCGNIRFLDYAKFFLKYSFHSIRF